MVKYSSENVLSALVVAIATFLITGIDSSSVSNPGYIRLFIAGAIGISGMILPGLSGSYLLLLTGVYYFVISGVEEFFSLSITAGHATKLAVFAAGVIVGGSQTVRLLKSAFEQNRDRVLAIILGLLVGSTRSLIPFVEAVTVHEGELDISSVPISEFTQNELLLIVAIFLITTVSVIALNRFLPDKT